MKKVKIISIICLMFLFACKKKTGESLFSKNDTIVSVSKVNTKDKTEKKEDIKTQSFDSCNETFDEFFERFSRDSLYQKSRVKYPLKWTYYESLENSKLTIEMRNHASYRFFSFIKDAEASKKIYGAFEVIKLKQRDTIIYQRKGLDNGLLINFKFKLVDDCWFMVEILDEST